MEEDKNYTETLEERIYEGRIENDEKDILRQLNLFLSNIIKRKRDDPIEGGLQATMIILPTSFGAKVTENDGKSVHERGFVNLVKHLNGDRKYLTDEGIRKLYLYKEESLQKIREGIEIRILDGENHLMLAITAQNNNQTEFQFDIIKKLLKYCKQIKDRGFYDIVEVGFHTKNIKIDFEDLDDNHFREIMAEIENVKSL